MNLSLGPRRRAVVSVTLLFLGLLCAAGCEKSLEASKEKTVQKRPHRPSLYEVPELSPAQLSAALRERCERAQEKSQPVLLEFSAPWCEDCLRLAGMKKAPALAAALQSVQFLTVNVGDFDQHAELLRAFEVKAIARWQLLEPTDCSVAPWQWKRLGSRTLEPETGQPVDTEQLAKWVSARSSG